MIGPPRLRTLASAVFAVFLATIPFEHSFEVPRLLLPATGGLLLLLADAMDRLGTRSLTQSIKGSAGLCARSILIHTLPPLVVGVLLLWLVSPSEDAGESVGELLKRSVVFVLFGGPLALRLAARNRSPAARLLLLLPLVFGFWCLWASCYGLDPEESLSLFAKEISAYLLGFYFLLNLLSSPSGSLRFCVHTSLALFAATSAAALLVLLAALAGPEAWLKALAESERIRIDFQSPGVDLVRAQFFFDSHNRLASYLLVGLLLTPVALANANSSRTVLVLLGAAGVIGLGILFSGTRGGVLAAVAGLMIPVLSRPRTLPVALAAGVFACLILPGPMRTQMATIFAPATYTRQDGNVQLRMKAWDNTFEMIRDRPILGFGYGWVIYEDLYGEYNKAGEDIEEKPHAHNNLLEITAETGVIGGGIFTGFQLTLGLMLGVGFLRAPARSRQRALMAAGLGVWMGLNFFGLSNYSLRRSVGAAVWIGWAFCAAIAIKINPESENKSADGDYPPSAPE